ncbi:MAG: hypothetical protein AB7E72_05875 [Lysobacterales bacterium]
MNSRLQSPPRRWPALYAPWVLLLPGLLLGALSSQASEAPSPMSPARSSHLQLSGKLMPLTRSSDGRFALQSQASFVPASVSEGGRFALLKTNVPAGASCDPLPDPLFANGFE